MNKESPYLSTIGTSLLLDHFNSTKKKQITGQKGQDYKNPDRLEKCTDIQVESCGVFIRYPHN